MALRGGGLMSFRKAGGEAYRPTAAASKTQEPPAAKKGRIEASYFARARKQSSSMKDYFDDDDDEEGGGPSRPPGGDDEGAGRSGSTNGASGKQEAEVDPLDAFMAGVETQVKEQAKTAGKPPPEKPERLDDLDEEDDMDDYGGALGQRGDQGSDYDSDAEVYAGDAAAGMNVDEDGVPLSYGRVPETKRRIEAVAALDHSNINYAPFRKNFYQEHPDVKRMSAAEVQEYMKELQIKTGGHDVPRPIVSFSHAGFDDTLLKEIVKRGFEAPTAIQAQALPVALSGRDIVGIAKTGSGKTFSFVWPAVVHVMDQPELQKGDGPIVVILAPTRELASQIYVEANKFAKIYGAKVAAVFGGAGKWEQQKLLKDGCEIVVATPGRLLDMVTNKSTNMRRCTMLVLDEADRMFDMGFEPQVRSVVGQIRPDRQTMLFTATFKKRVEQLASDVLRDPVRIVVGTMGQANEDIKQEVVVLKDDSGKWGWLTDHIDSLVAKGKVLIFVSSKQGCDELANNLTRHAGGKLKCDAIHGDKDQFDRLAIIKKYKHGELPILIATDVASRGLDIKDINNVVNYDVAKTIEIHVHRIGRTGRMNIDGVHPGTATTLLTQKDTGFASDLVRNLELSKQVVPEELRALAKHSIRRGGGGGGGGGGGAGRGRITEGIGFGGRAGGAAVPPPSAGLHRTSPPPPPPGSQPSRPAHGAATAGLARMGFVAATSSSAASSIAARAEQQQQQQPPGSVGTGVPKKRRWGP